MTETQPSEKILDRVRKLIDLANHPETPEHEAAAALERADRLMTQHSIDEAMLESVRPDVQRQVVSLRKKLFQSNWEFDGQLRQLVVSIGRHMRIRAVRHSNEEHTVVGYSDDLEYFELVWTGTYLAFISKLDPRWDPSLTEDANVYRLVESGSKWERIARMGGFDWPDGGKLKRAYRRECSRLGVEPRPHTQRHEAYRQAYADAFVTRIAERIFAQSATRHETVKTTTGAEVALRDATARVNAKVWDLFPALRPRSEAELRQEAETARLAEAERVAALTPAQRLKEQRKLERDWAAYERQAERNEKARTDDTGANAGRKAADSVDLSGGRNAIANSRRQELG